MSVACTTDTCERHGEPIANPFDYPADAIVCGACGGPVQDVPDQPEPE